MSLAVRWFCSLLSDVQLQGGGCCKSRHQTGDVFSLEWKENSPKHSSCRVRGQKSTLSYRHAELGAKFKKLELSGLLTVLPLRSPSESVVLKMATCKKKTKTRPCRQEGRKANPPCSLRNGDSSPSPPPAWLPDSHPGRWIFH